MSSFVYALLILFGILGFIAFFVWFVRREDRKTAARIPRKPQPHGTIEPPPVLLRAAPIPPPPEPCPRRWGYQKLDPKPSTPRERTAFEEKLALTDNRNRPSGRLPEAKKSMGDVARLPPPPRRTHPRGLYIAPEPHEPPLQRSSEAHKRALEDEEAKRRRRRAREDEEAERRRRDGLNTSFSSTITTPGFGGGGFGGGGASGEW